MNTQRSLTSLVYSNHDVRIEKWQLATEDTRLHWYLQLLRRCAVYDKTLTVSRYLLEMACSPSNQGIQPEKPPLITAIENMRQRLTQRIGKPPRATNDPVIFRTWSHHEPHTKPAVRVDRWNAASASDRLAWYLELLDRCAGYNATLIFARCSLDIPSDFIDPFDPISLLEIGQKKHEAFDKSREEDPRATVPDITAHEKNVKLLRSSSTFHATWIIFSVALIWIAGWVTGCNATM